MAQAGLRRQPGVLSVEPDCLVHLEQTPNDPSFGQQWDMVNTGQTGGTPGADINAAAAWNIRTDASAVTVAIVDTGLQLTHPDLAANVWTNPGEIPGNGIDDDGNGYIDDVHGWDFVNNDAIPDDDNGHGTHVAGTIGAIGNNNAGISGVAWSVKLMPLKAFDASGNGSVSAIIAALDYAVANGARVSNHSYGGTSYVQAEYDAFAAAQAAGHVAFVAAGNDGESDDDYPHYPAAFRLDEVVSVAATTASDTLASFSNYGTHTVQVAAPGVSIRSTLRGSTYGNLSGTSQATPHVTGVAALVAAEHLDWTGSQIRDRVLGTTRPVAALAGTSWTGGVVDAGAALGGGPTILPPPPPSPGSAPTADIDLDEASDSGVSATDRVTNAATLVWNVTFNRPVSGFAAADLSRSGTATGCAIQAPSGSGPSYTVSVTGCSAGTVHLTLKPNTVTDDSSVSGPAVALAGPIALIDRSAPTVSTPTATPRAAATLAGTSIPLRIGWTGSDPGGAGLASYTLQESTDSGHTWSTISASLSAPLLNVLAVPSGTVRYRAQGTDRAGNAGAWATGPSLAPLLVQQTSSAIRYHGTWSSSGSTTYSGGSTRYARTAGASVSYAFSGRSIAWIGSTSTTRGKVKVYVNGAYVGTVDLSGPTRHRVLIWQKTWTTVATRTLTLVDAGTGGRPRADLDAFAVLR